MMSIVMGALLATIVAATAPPRLPSGPLPDGLGVNIHFTDPQPGEMEMMAAAGFTWVRMDFDWNQVEYEKGKYRFDAYDRLMNALEKHRMRPIFILDYVHRFYDDAQSPQSDEAIEAFARFAAASAKHFRGRGILWEMYNEPNIYPFWRPKPNVQDYIRLATAVGRAIRQEAPGEAYIGPATSGMDFAFLEACFKGGLLEYWDAVSVHPYRQTPPETVIPDYLRLRDLIRRYAPRGKTVPIISGEWGYSSVWSGMDPEKQGKILPRQWLTNNSCGIPLSIWYDWHDDGPDPKEPEHHFGTVLHPYHAGRTPVYDAKPGYLAAQTLTSQLRGFRFSKRLMVGDRDHFVLLFRRGKDVRVVAWTVRTGGSEVVIPASPGSFRGVDHLGKVLAPMTAAGPGLRIKLQDAPVYLEPVRPNPVLAVAAAWQNLPLDTPMAYKPTVTLKTVLPNVTTRRLTIREGVSAMVLAPGQKCQVSRTERLQRRDGAIPVQISVRVDNAAPLVQETNVLLSNPLAVTVLPPSGDRLALSIVNPSGQAFDGTARIVATGGADQRVVEMPFVLRNGEERRMLTAEIAQLVANPSIGVQIRERSGAVILTIKPQRFVSAGPAFSADQVQAGQLVVVPDGDPKVESEQTLTEESPGIEPPLEGMRIYTLTYRFGQGWKFLRVVPPPGLRWNIEGRPVVAGIWLHGDGKGNIPRLRFVDATGQTFQPDGEPITWKGWRYVEFPMDGSKSGRWGGANDGVIHYPIHWDTVFLLDSAGGAASSGSVCFGGLTLIYK